MAQLEIFSEPCTPSGGRIIRRNALPVFGPAVSAALPITTVRPYSSPMWLFPASFMIDQSVLFPVGTFVPVASVPFSVI